MTQNEKDMADAHHWLRHHLNEYAEEFHRYKCGQSTSVEVGYMKSLVFEWVNKYRDAAIRVEADIRAEVAAAKHSTGERP